MLLYIWRRGSHNCENWNGFFATICWLIWIRRNERVFENKIMTNEALILRGRSIIEVMKHSAMKLKGVNMNGSPVVDREEKWEYPPVG